MGVQYSSKCTWFLVSQETNGGASAVVEMSFCLFWKWMSLVQELNTESEWSKGSIYISRLSNLQSVESKKATLDWRTRIYSKAQVSLKVLRSRTSWFRRNKNCCCTDIQWYIACLQDIASDPRGQEQQVLHEIIILRCQNKTWCN